MEINFEELELKHKYILNKYFKINKTEVSEFNFTEMFIWRKVRKTVIGFINDNICIKVERHNKRIMYRPFGNKNIKETIDFIFDNDFCDMIYGYIDKEIEKINIEGKYIFEKDRDDFDYVYLTDDLVNLRGRKYDGKRNHIKKFKQLNYSIEFISDEIIGEVIDFQKKWCKDRLCEDDLSLKNESRAINELFEHYNELPVLGAALFVNGQIEGYTVATELNPETVIIIVEKANPQIKGIYQGLNQLFAEQFLFKYKYINREQDLGNEGLRKAKMSYHPNHFVKKFIIKKKENK